jgi:hypothetical protein
VDGLQGSLLHVAVKSDTISSKKPPMDDNVDDMSVEIETGDWWRATIDIEGENQVKRVKCGYKVVLLLHILTFAEQVGDKVVIFANSIPTLNYLEYVLALDWTESVPSLATIASSSSGTLGRWQKTKDYVRIDGSISSSERGALVDQFEGDVGVKAFLISQAGGIGINLVRCVMDIEPEYSSALSVSPYLR